MKKGAVLALASVLSFSAQADWALDEGAQLSFLSTKVFSDKRSVTEQSSFTDLSGVVSDQGALSLEVTLASVATNIDIRNTRMKDWLFEISQYPVARITGQIDMNKVTALQAGELLQLQQPLQLDVHGQQQTLSAALQLHKLANGAVQVTTTSPLLLDTGKLAMTAGVAKLTQAAGLSSINQQVPVLFNGTFVDK